MKRFVFKFESPLRLKQQQRRQADLRLDAARAQLQAATRIVAHLHEQLEQVAQSMVNASASGEIERRHLAAQKYIERLRAEIGNANAHVRRVDQELHDARNAFRALSVEVERFELLQSEQREDYRAYQQADRQHDVDQFVLRQWSAANSETHDA